jgi:tripartite-type tricarboxylate transporter receptor subunit TctC
MGARPHFPTLHALFEMKKAANLGDRDGFPMPMTPAEFGKLIADEIEKWGKVIRTANIKPD